MKRLDRWLMRCALFAMPLVTVAARSTSAQGTATLVGVVRDTAGVPIAAAELVLTRGDQVIRTMRTGAQGAFTLDSVSPGLYSAWFRQVGYSTLTYTWDARAGERTEVRPVLRRMLRTLDPVIVRAEEERAMKRTASVLGQVVDDDRKPVDEATVDVIGAGQSGTTRANGGFLFEPMPLGTHVLRVRKIGYAPSVLTVELLGGEQREVIIRMRRLPANLSDVVITARSGFGTNEEEWEALDRRLRWHGSRNFVLGPEDLRRYAGAGLDVVAKSIGVEFAEIRVAHRKGGPTSIMGATRGKVGDLSAFGVAGDACILLNGRTMLHLPLTSFATRNIELLEVYPSRTEVSGSVADRMHGPCQQTSDGHHPTWYVIWLIGEK